MAAVVALLAWSVGASVLGAVAPASAASSAPITPGAPVRVTIARPGDVWRGVLPVTPGVRVVFTAPDGGGWSDVVTVTVRRTDGTVALVWSSDSYPATKESSGLAAAPENWTVEVRSDRGATGSSRFVFSEVTDLVSSAAPGTKQTFRIDQPGRNVRWPVAVSGGGRIGCAVAKSALFQGDWETTPTTSVLGPDGQVIGTCDDSPLAPVSGTYTVVVDPYGLSVGNIIVGLAVSRDREVRVTPGTPVTIATRALGEHVRLLYRALPGSRPTLTGQVTSLTSQRLAQPLADGRNLGVLVGRLPTGTDEGEVRWQTGDTMFGDWSSEESAGTRVLDVHPENGAVATMTVTLGQAPDLAATATPGKPLHLHFAVAGQQARVTFYGQAGQRPTALLDNATWDPALNWSDPPPIQTLIRPDGSVAAPGLASGDLTWQEWGPLDQTGEWTMVVDPPRATTGEADLTIGTVTDRHLSIPRATPTRLTLRTPGQNLVAPVTLQAGQRLGVTLDGIDLRAASPGGAVGVHVALIDPHGNRFDGVVPYYPFSGSTAAFGEAAASVSGTYTLVVDPDMGTIGSLTMSLDATAVTTLTPTVGASQPVSFGRPEAQVDLLVPGSPGTTTLSLRDLHLTATSHGGYPGSGVVDVLACAPRGQGCTPVSSYITGDRDISLSLPGTGTWTVRLDPEDDTVGTLTATVSR